MNTPLVTNSLRALLRWWWLIALSVSLGVGAGFMLRTTQETLYVSQAIIAVGDDPDRPVPVGATRQVLNGYAVLLRRPTLIQPVIDDLGLDVGVKDLLDRMSVEIEQLASLINITIVDTDPDRAAAIANRIVQELIAQTSESGQILDMEFVTSQIESVQNQINSLQDQFDQLLDEAETLQSAFALSQNLAERERIDQTIRDLRADLLGLAENAPRSEVQIFEAAVPNYYPWVTNSIRDLIFAGMAGAMLSVLTIILFTFFDDRLQWNEWRDETMMGLRILGPLGIIPRKKLPLYVDTMPGSVEAEALRQVRAKVALAAGGKHPRVITIMSYDSGEGKTLTSANYALETAQAGMRTLVIDGDMRRGDLHEIFRLPNVFGLSDVLVSNAPLKTDLVQAILDSGYENLSVLPFGRSESDPAALLSRPRFQEMIEILSQLYDAIVIDAAPTIGGPDSIFLGEASNGVIVVINTRRTRLSSLKRSLEELSEGPNVNIYGLVFNRVRLQITSKYNNNYYRQTPTLNAAKLGREMDKPSSGLMALRANVITDKNGEKLYSITATAARLGVKKRTVQSWLDTGYLTAKRRFMRRWIAESKIHDLMATRQTAQPQPAATLEPVATEIPNGTGTYPIPDHVRDQRNAILDFANKPDHNADPEI